MKAGTRGQIASDVKRHDQLIELFCSREELLEICFDGECDPDFLLDQKAHVLTEKSVLAEFFEAEKCAVTGLFSFENFQ